MGTWRNRQNAILIFFTTKKNWIIAFFLFLGTFEFAASYVNHLQNQNVWKSIASLLRNEINSANTYQMSRALSDMEAENWIKCVSLVETTNETRIFYDTTSKSYCGHLATKIEGNLTSINGSTWNLRFAIPESIWFLIVRLLIPFLVGAALYFAHGLQNRQRKLQEAARLRAMLEKDILLDLTKQTRHDIASPIGALKIVVQRLEVAPEYTEILQGIVERIEGIFSQLQKIDGATDIISPYVSLEAVPLEKIVNSIIAEKLSEWDLGYNFISAQLIPVSVVANRVEIERIFSNLVNNAIEAKRENVRLSVKVEVNSFKNMCSLRITDNGIGMDTDTLSNVGKKGFSYGKSKGNSGLGLNHAIRTIESFGGELKIASELGVGTSISILLKRSE